MDNLSPESPTVAPVSPEATVPAIAVVESRPASSPVSKSAAQKEGFLAIGIALGYLLFWQVALRIPSGHIAVVGITTLLSLGLVLLFSVRTARALSSPRVLFLNLVLSGVLALPSVLLPLLSMRFPGWSGWETMKPAWVIYLKTVRFLPGLGGLLLIWFASGLGAWLSRMVREIKILLPMAVMLAFVDMYVVFGGGLVTQAQSGQSPAAAAAMQALTVHLPTTAPKGGAAPMQLAVGFADFLFIALFFACFQRFGIPSRRTFQVLGGVLAFYMLLVALTGLPLPALVPIAVVIIGMNLRQFRYERSEGFALLYAGLIVAAVAGGFYFFSHH